MQDSLVQVAPNATGKGSHIITKPSAASGWKSQFELRCLDMEPWFSIVLTNRRRNVTRR